MSIFQSIIGLNGLIKDIAFTQKSKIAICWKAQLISERNTEKRVSSNSFLDHHWLFQSCKALEAKTGVAGGAETSAMYPHG